MISVIDGYIVWVFFFPVALCYLLHCCSPAVLQYYLFILRAKKENKTKQTNKKKPQTHKQTKTTPPKQQQEKTPARQKSTQTPQKSVWNSEYYLKG